MKSLFINWGRSLQNSPADLSVGFSNFMRSIEANYKKIQARNPSLGTYSCLSKAVRDRKFSRKSLVKAFNDLMPESEYAKDEKKELIDCLDNVSNPSEEGEFCTKFRSESI